MKHPIFLVQRSNTMIPNAVLQDFETLPLDAQQQVIDFIDFIKARYQARVTKQSQSTLESSFGSIKVKKKVTLEQMDETIRQRGATL
ncbi:hypothetical protein [Thiothrix unzii]|jgi:hypothetical protein|uniref:hypothetical protein n=1 Tax=Thiothrix unzii TaxID=111769 RepID=UPI002A3705F8|nr:hypothetical protein [Thiothrix unzii]MDX9988729.1 hypothetical protein [Thiothrix unzii]